MAPLPPVESWQLVFDGLPAPARAALVKAVTGLAIGASRSVWTRIRNRLFLSPEARGRRDALATAVASVLRGYPDLSAIDLAGALTRPPFSDLVISIIDEPQRPVAADQVVAAFAASMYDLAPLGIDEVAFVEAIRAEMLDALRLSSELATRTLHTGIRLEQLHAGQERIEAVVQALGPLAAPSSIAGPVDDVDTRFAEAKALYDRGAVRSALRIWERLRDELLQGEGDPSRRAKVLSNIGFALIDLNRPPEALAAFRAALEYAPDSATAFANAAQAAMFAGGEEEAGRLVDRALELDPAHETAWFVRAQMADPPLHVAAIPEGLREKPQMLLARGLSAARHDAGAGLALLRDALRHGRREPQLLLLLAERLYASLFPRRLSDPVPQDLLAELRRLADEAADMLAGTERQAMYARALVLQGTAADLAGAPDHGASYFRLAAELDGESPRARVAAANAQLSIGNAQAAIYLLDAVPVVEQTPVWHALRARALVELDRASELDGHVGAVVDAPPREETGDAAQALGEACLLGGRPELVGRLLPLLHATDWADIAHVFEARVAARAGEADTAVAAYEAALSATAPARRPEIEAEYASFLMRAGKLDNAASHFEAAGADEEHSEATRLYAVCLKKLGRLDELARLLERVATHGRLAPWMLEARADLALVRDDLPGARAALDELMALEPENVYVRLLRAHVANREDDLDAVARLVEPLEAREDLDAYDSVNLALHLVRVGRAGPALRHAYRALRLSPDDAQLQQAAVVGVFFAPRGADQAPPELFARATVEPDTWLKVRAAGGEEREYLILAEGPADVRRNELLASDPRARKFLGRRVGDTVVLREGAVNEQSFVVVELKSAMLHAFHDAMQNFQDRFPEAHGLQSIHVGEGEDFDPSPIIRLLHDHQERREKATALYRERLLPLGVLAVALGQSVRRTLYSFIGSRIPVFTDHPAPERVGATRLAAEAPGVVLTISGLTTLDELGHLDLLPRLFARILLPQSLLDEMNAELAEWEHASARGGFRSASLEGAAITMQEVGVDEVNRVASALRELRDKVIEMSEVVPRVLAGAEPKERELIGASSYDAMLASGPDVVLHADDWGLRQLTSARQAHEGCSTFALLARARAEGLLSDEAFDAARLRLVALGYTLIPLDAPLLYSALVANAFGLSGAARRALEALAEPDRQLAVAVQESVALLRTLALSSVGRIAFGPTGDLVFERLLATREPHVVLQPLTEAIDREFALLPRERADLMERLRRIATARLAGGLLRGDRN